MTDNNFHYSLVKEHINNPNIIKVNDVFIYKNIKNKFDKYIEISKISELTPFSDDDYIHNSTILKKINDELYLSYNIQDELSDDSTISELTFYYLDGNYGFIDKFIKELKSEIFQINEIKDYNSNLNFLHINSNGFGLLPLKIKSDIDIELCYNDETLKSLKNLNINGTGLWVFSGRTGTGKTSALKYLADKNKDINFIYIPINLIDNTINSSEIIDIITNNTQTIIILDDFDRLFTNFDIKGNQIINNISQLIDNFFFEEDSIGFIIINNSEDDSTYIDDLFNINNFKEVIEFKELEKTKINKISKLKNTNKKEKYSSLNDVVNNKPYRQKKLTGF